MANLTGESTEAAVPGVLGQNNTEPVLVLGTDPQGPFPVDPADPGIHAGPGAVPGNSIGVHGVSANGIAVLASSEKGSAVIAISNSGLGVQAQSLRSFGVHAYSGENVAVRAVAQTQAAVHATSESGAGILAASKETFGVSAYSEKGIAVQAGAVTNSAVDATSDTGNGVSALSTKAIGIYAKGGQFAGYFEGDVMVTGDVQLKGADCAEYFDVLDPAEIKPGTVMIIGLDGLLRRSAEPYDKRVAGVVSGAGDFKPALLLDKHAQAKSRLPIALLGKVYCWADADFDAIQIGDLLTTSSTPGHAMKVMDFAKAPGGVIGKAMCALPSGRALIPILIALQ